jgi:hypothetical protein
MVPMGNTITSNALGGIGAFQNAGGNAMTFAAQARKQICVLHGKPLRYFCDSCEELICYDCTVMGPHNT